MNPHGSVVTSPYISEFMRFPRRMNVAANATAIQRWSSNYTKSKPFLRP